MRLMPTSTRAFTAARVRVALVQLVVALLAVALVDYAYEAIVFNEQLVRIGIGAVR